MDLSTPSRIAIVSSLLVLAAIGARLFRKQRAGAIGGPIAVSKLLWLLLVVFLWLMLAPILALDPAVPVEYRWVFGIFGLNFWLRGAVEMVLMYGTNSWRPPYGIAHDLLSIGLVVGLGVLFGPLPFERDGAWFLALAAVIVVTLALESGYAWAFFRLVGGHTHGEGAIWFASTDDPRFRTILRVTAAANVPLYAFVLAFLAKGLSS